MLCFWCKVVEKLDSAFKSRVEALKCLHSVRAYWQQNSGTAMYKPEEIALVGEACLKHAVASTDQRLVCTMAMVCKGWSAAVKDKAPAGLLDVSLKVGNRWAPDDAGMPSECMLKLASFSDWLPQHAKLIRKLEITGDRYSPRGSDVSYDKNRTWFKALAETVFSLALRSAAPACIETNAQQQVQPLGLQSYSSDVLDTSAVLQSLPVASLTELMIRGSDRSGLAAALFRLTNLQRLDTYGFVDDKPMAAVLQAAQRLSALTELSFPNQYFSSSDVKLVPPHLSRLELSVTGSSAVDFSHLTRLTSLRIVVGPDVGYRFPAQLVELGIADGYINEQDGVSSVVSISNISSLKCLKALDITNPSQNAEDLCQLVALPKLEKLSLRYYDRETALASAAWSKLRQLQHVDLSELDWSSSACMQVFCNLGKVTWLTRLHVFFRLAKDAEQQAVPIVICGEISKLKMLQDMYLHVNGNGLQQSSWAQDDLARLSNLTQLTKLDLHVYSFVPGDIIYINDATVIQLLLKLKQLQELSVPVQSVAVLPVIAQLSNLRVLGLKRLPEALQRSGLRYLQNMKSLTVLEGFENCSKQELADFWAVVRA